MRIFLVDILTFDGFFDAKFDILKPRWLPTFTTSKHPAVASGYNDLARIVAGKCRQRVDFVLDAVGQRQRLRISNRRILQIVEGEAPAPQSCRDGEGNRELCREPFWRENAFSVESMT